MFDERIATDVSASQNSREVAGFLQVAATAAPGHTLGELDRAIGEEIARLTTDGPTDDEIDRGRVQAESHFTFRLQTVGGFGGKSDQLNAYNVFVGDAEFYHRGQDQPNSVEYRSHALYHCGRRLNCYHAMEADQRNCDERGRGLH